MIIIIIAHIPEEMKKYIFTAHEIKFHPTETSRRTSSHDNELRAIKPCEPAATMSAVIARRQHPRSLLKIPRRIPPQKRAIPPSSDKSGRAGPLKRRQSISALDNSPSWAQRAALMSARARAQPAISRASFSALRLRNSAHAARRLRGRGRAARRAGLVAADLFR